MRRRGPVAGSELPALLDLVQADVQVAVPSPALEDAVLDRFVRERARSAPRRRRWPRLAIPAVAVAALLAALLVVSLPGDTNTAYAHADLWSLPAGGGAEGTADVAAVAGGHPREAACRPSSGHAAGDVRAVVRAHRRPLDQRRELPRAPDGTAAAELTARSSRASTTWS